MHTIALILGVGCGALFILKMVAMLIGAEGEFEAGDASDGFSILSVNTVLGFGMSFGFTWLAFHYQGMSDITANIGAFVVASFLSVIFAYLLFSLRRAESGEIKDNGLSIGDPVDITIRVPGNNIESGQIRIKSRGAYRHVTAYTKDSEDILAGTAAYVTDPNDAHVLVSVKKPTI